mmetsp:Transcript_17238/g.25964  ORF Transcript_17238/g.25964 Transcript_17238/m.25964 type:complete len:168 (-) Transcript_17238:926-1429(-)
MPLLAKVCAMVTHRRKRYENNMELCGYIPHSEYEYCRSANISLQITEYLPRAQTNLELFDIILVLDNYADTATLLCTLLQWPVCDLTQYTIAYRKHRERLNHRKTHGPIKNAHLLWQQRNCSSSFLNFDTALSMHKPSILFYNFALSLTQKQMAGRLIPPQARGLGR